MTTAVTQTITSFLLARLEEDEAAARSDFAAYSMHWPWCDFPGDMPGTCTCNLRARVLAECAAKRAIVELCGVDGGVFDDDAPDGIRYDGHPVTRALAAVYADHEQYRPEWKP